MILPITYLLACVPPKSPDHDVIIFWCPRVDRTCARFSRLGLIFRECSQVHFVYYRRARAHFRSSVFVFSNIIFNTSTASWVFQTANLINYFFQNDSNGVKEVHVPQEMTPTKVPLSCGPFLVFISVKTDHDRPINKQSAVWHQKTLRKADRTWNCAL